MSRILGLWNRDGSPAERQLLAEMAALTQYPQHDAASLHLQREWGAACQILRVTPESQTETQPFVAPNGTFVVYDGRLDNRVELLADAKVSPEVSDSELIRALYRAQGVSAFARLAGDFAFAIADASARKLFLVRDAIGVRPLYYTNAGSTLLFASEIKSLLAHPRVSTEPNDELLAWFLLRYPATDVAGATFFKGIQSVRPGFYVEVSPDNIETKRYWDFDPSQRIRLNSFPQYAEAFAEVFGRAVTRRCRSVFPVSIAVSGGLDSSAVMCWAAKNGYAPQIRPVTHTFNPGTAADEEAFVDELERHCGVNVERFRTPVGFRKNMQASLSSAEMPLLDEMADCQAELFRRMHATGARSYLTGLWGDQVLFDYSYLTSLVWRGRWATVKRHLHGFADWYPDVGYEYFRTELARATLRSALPNPLLNAIRKWRFRNSGASRKRFYAQRLTSMAPSFESARKPVDEFSSRQARSLYYTARSASYLLQMEVANKNSARFGLENSTPFLDRDVIAFLMAIPGEVANHDGVPKAILRTAMQGVLPPTVALRRAKSDGTAFANSAMHQAFPEMVEMLKDGAAVTERGYLGTNVISQLLQQQDKIVGKDSTWTFELSEIFGLELWLRTFFGSNPALKNALSASGATE